MAEENEEQQQHDEAQEAKPKKPKGPMWPKIVLLLNVLGVLGGGGYVAWALFIHEKALIMEQNEQKRLKQEAVTKGMEYKIVPMDAMTVNVKPTSGKLRYVRLKVEFEVSQVLEEKLKNRFPRIRDIIVGYVSDKTFFDLRQVQGKLVLKDQIRNSVNDILGGKYLQSVNFTEYVLQ